MKKLLLPIFGGLLLTSSITLTTGQNVNVVVKQKEQEEIKQQELLNSWYSINRQSQLSETKIKEVQIASQNWNNELIDNVLNQALQYQDNQLIIDTNKLDANKLPKELLENIDLALANLNNAVSLGYIKVNVTNNIVQLIYPNNNNTNNDIIDFEDKILSSSTYNSAYGSYMWYSTYGPSRWWKIWEWGGYIHFSEQAVENAKVINVILSLVTEPAKILSMFVNIGKLGSIVVELGNAINAGNTTAIKALLVSLSKLLGDVVLDGLGEVIEIFAIFSVVVAFITTMITIPFLGTFFALLAGIISSVVIKIINGDQGKGVKWQWHNFVIPGNIWSE